MIVTAPGTAPKSGLLRGLASVGERPRFRDEPRQPAGWVPSGNPPGRGPPPHFLRTWLACLYRSFRLTISNRALCNSAW